jgi:hypothetical protein
MRICGVFAILAVDNQPNVKEINLDIIQTIVTTITKGDIQLYNG